MSDLHSCSWHCQNPACILVQRDMFRDAMLAAPDLEHLLGEHDALLARVAWQPIETAPRETGVWLFDATLEPQQFVGRLTEGYDGPYWSPDEQLVSDVMDAYLHPTHWQPLPAPPARLVPEPPK